jgi:putative chitinase
VLGGQGNDVLSKFDINKNTLRFCHFMAQVGHECGGFTIVEENLNYSAKRMVEIFGPKIHSAKITAAEAAKLVGNKEAFAERVYGLGNPTKARDLGNTQPGDGYRYRGRGFLQITGRAAYREMGKRIGVDLEANPDLAGQPLGALMTAAAFWDSRKLNTYADQDNITIITKRINGGQNGLADRKANYRKAVDIWGDDDDRSVTREGTRSRGPRELQYGDLGPDVLEVKRMLSVLGYDGFVMDEDFSKATHLAVASFQIDRGLDGDGVVDAETSDLLEREAKAAGYVPQTPAPGSEHAQWPPRPHTYNVGRGHAVWVWGVILLLCAATLLGLKFFENPRVLQSQSFRNLFDLAVGGTIGLGAIILIALGRRIARSSRRRPHTLTGGGVADDGLRREPGGD